MVCATINNLSYSAFSERLHTMLSGRRIPLSGSLELTMRCNLRCEHCYVPFTQRAGSRQDELTLPELQRIFSEIAEAGCLWLLLTGGEPLLRNDFLDIYDDAKRKGFLISVFTNGTLLTNKVVNHLAERRPFSIEISIYGATQATYERVTGIPGSYTRCMHGIERVIEHNLPLKLKSVLITLNQHELTQMKQFSENLGLPFRFDPVISAGIDGNLYPIQYRLSPEQIVIAEQQDPDRANKWPEFYKEYKDLEINTNKMYVCNAGRSGFHIDATGKLNLCLSARTPYYDLRMGSFQEGWDHFIDSTLALEYSQAFSCSNCELRTVCAQCPAMGLAECGDPEARVPFLCQLAHLRQEAFDFDLISSVR